MASKLYLLRAFFGHFFDKSTQLELAVFEFSEILLEFFFQNFSLSFSQFSLIFQTFVLFLLNPENKEFFNVIKLVRYRIY